MPITRVTRNVAVLAASQALFMTSATMLIIFSGLVGFSLAENKALATLPVSAVMIGNALTMVPASLLMERIGRRPGFILGALFGVFGAVVAAVGIFAGNFALFVLGNAIVGVYAGFAQYYRFAAADVAGPEFKSTAISLVIAGGVVAALFGPELAKWSNGLLAPTRFLGSYLVVAGLGLAAAALLLLLDIPRLREEGIREPGRPLHRIMRQPVFLVAVIAGMMGYGVTILMMTAAPLAMASYRHAFDHTAFVIQWHTVAMFAPAFFTGSLIRRFGVLNVMLIGTTLLAGCVVAALMGVDLVQFSLGLAALGLGWNFTFIGASTLLTEAYLPAERAKVQAANDFLVFGSVATASLLSGVLLDAFDWQAVNYAAVPFLLATGGAILWLATSRRVGRPPALAPDGASGAMRAIGFNPPPTALAKAPSARTGNIGRFGTPFSSERYLRRTTAMKTFLPLTLLLGGLAGAASQSLAASIVYVPTGGAGEILVIDADRDAIVDRITGVEDAHGLASTTDGGVLVAGMYAEITPQQAALPPKPEGMSEEMHRAHHAKRAGDAVSKREAVSFVSVIRTEDGVVTRRIAVPGAVHHTALTRDGRYAVATHPNGGGISVIDLSAFTILKSVDTGSVPNYVVVSSDGRRVYVSNGGEDTVSEIDTDRWVVRRNIPTGETPGHMVLSPDDGTLYVANADAGTVSVVSLEQGQVAETYVVGGELHGIDLSDDGQTLFVSAREKGKLVAIGLGQQRMRELSLAPAPYHLTAVRGTGKIYVSSAEEPKIWVVDQQSLEPLGEIPIGGTGHQMVVVRR